MKVFFPETMQALWWYTFYFPRTCCIKWWRVSEYICGYFQNERFKKNARAG